MMHIWKSASIVSAENWSLFEGVHLLCIYARRQCAVFYSMLQIFHVRFIDILELLNDDGMFGVHIFVSQIIIGALDCLRNANWKLNSVRIRFLHVCSWCFMYNQFSRIMSYSLNFTIEIICQNCVFVNMQRASQSLTLTIKIHWWKLGRAEMNIRLPGSKPSRW